MNGNGTNEPAMAAPPKNANPPSALEQVIAALPTITMPDGTQKVPGAENAAEMVRMLVQQIEARDRKLALVDGVQKLLAQASGRLAAL